MARREVLENAGPNQPHPKHNSQDATSQERLFGEYPVQKLVAKTTPAATPVCQEEKLVGDNRSAQEDEPHRPKEQTSYETVDHPFLDHAVLKIKLKRRDCQDDEEQRAKAEAQREQPRRVVEQYRIEDGPQVA